MTARKTGFTIGRLIRIPLVVLTLFILFILCKGSIALVTSFAVPFGFTSGTATALTTVAVIFFLSIGVLVAGYLYTPGDSN